jgi:hypothetical protein
MATTVHTFANTACVYVTRAFSCDHPATRCHAYCASGGTVRVYDEVAGHFTADHNLTERQQAMVRRALGVKLVEHRDIRVQA